MAISLIRNSRVFYTTNVNANTGVVNTSGFTIYNTAEIQVLDGFSFSQNTNADTITLNEAGPAPVRGQRSFNSSLAPVEWSFSTYARPNKLGTVTAEERFLWNSLVSNTGSIAYVGSEQGIIDGAWTETEDYAEVNFVNSDSHQLVKFGLIIALDNATFIIDNACLNQASIDFGIDQIATIAWSGMGGTLRRLTNPITLTDITAGYLGSFSDDSAHVAFGNGYTGSAKAKDINAPFIANKLSTSYVASGIGAYIGSSTNIQYSVPLIGGNININNNITYLTPAVLGTVNRPFTYFTGTRAVTGTLSAYLRTGAAGGANMSGDVGALFSALTTDAALSAPDNKYSLYVDLGGITNATRVRLDVPNATLQIPSVRSEAVISADINFTGQGGYSGSSNQSYDITVANEAAIRYHSA